jgi:short-subunit dehydrogenase/acyl carrier protein
VPAQVWGAGRVFGLEHPERWGGLVDLPADIDDRVGAKLRQVLATAGDEDQLAIRPRGVYVRRLVPAPIGDPEPHRRWAPTGTALVTGGTGGIGAKLARWLVEAGTEHVVLTSRSGPAADGADELRAELTALGARVTIASCDVADRDAVAALLAALGEPVTAVIHAAGVVQATTLAQMSLDEFAAVVSAKAVGAANLDALLGDQLDAFVLFSSNAGVWGSGGQAAYAAANAFLDALAECRRGRGALATSVAWGAWSGGGMAANPDAEEHLRRRGVLPMAPDRALAALQQAIEHDETHVAIADVDWARFATGFTAARPRPLLDELPGVQRALAAPEPAPSPGDPGDRLRQLSDPEREAALGNLVNTAVAAVLGYDADHRIEGGRAFKDLGFDSLTSVELRNRLSTATGLRLPATLVFDHPTPVDLVALLRAKLGGDQPRLSPAEAVLADLDRLEAGISALSPDQDLAPVSARLRSLVSVLGDRSQSAGVPVTRQLETATDDELFEFIHREFGKAD